MGSQKGLFVESFLFCSNEKLSEGLTYRLRDELSFARFPKKHIGSQTSVGAFSVTFLFLLASLHVNEFFNWDQKKFRDFKTPDQWAGKITSPLWVTLFVIWVEKRKKWKQTFPRNVSSLTFAGESETEHLKLVKSVKIFQTWKQILTNFSFESGALCGNFLGNQKNL